MNPASLLRKADSVQAQESLSFQHESNPRLYRGLTRKLVDYQSELGIQADLLELLEESNTKYRDLFDNAPAGYLIVDRNAVILDANLAAVELLGVEKDLMIKMPLTTFILKKYFETFFRHLNQARLMLTPSHCEVIIRRKNAAPFYAHLQTVKAEDGKGLPSFRIVVCDITESKMLEKLIRLECRPIKPRNRTLSTRKEKKSATQH